MKTDGFANLEKKLLDLSKTEGGMRNAMRKNVEIITEKAKDRTPVNSGNLKDSIQNTVYTDDDKIVGKVYTTTPYGAYVEFGTGPKGAESDHSEVSPNISITYKNKGWIIPASAMSVSEAERYHFVILKDRTTGEVIGYGTRGQPAHPFLYPAIKDSEEEIIGTFKEEISEEIRKKAD